MQLAEALDVAKQVLLDKRVIIVTIVCLVYLEIVHYVVHYKKKPPKVRKARITVAAPKPAQKTEGESSDEDDSSEATAASSKKTSSAKSAPASSLKK